MQERLDKIEAKRANCKGQIQERRSLLINDIFKDDSVMTAECKMQCVEGYQQFLTDAEADFNVYRDELTGKKVEQL